MTTQSHRTAIVTGGSRGFGKAIAAALTGDGWRVIIDGRDAEVLAHAAADIGGDVVAMAGDVADAAHRDQLVARATETGRLDLLVNNASTLGVSPLRPIAQTPLAALDDTFLVNVVAPVALIQRALPLLRHSKGAVVNVTSDAGVEAYETWGGYGASKAALDHLSRVLAVEEPDIDVWAFDPGDMRTEMHQAAFPDDDISDRPDPEAVVPAFLRLLRDRPATVRLRAADLAGVPA